MFGNTSQTPAFGSGNASNTSAFGSSAAAPGTSNTSTGMFGKPQPFGAATGGGLFGNSGASNPSGSSSFGTNSSNGLNGQNALANNGVAFSPFGANKPASSGPGVFGNTTSTTTNNGLFGSNTSNSSTSGGLFGNTGSNTSTSTGLFGNTSNNNTSGTGGLFGNTSNNKNSASTSGGLFGNTSATSASSSGPFGAKPATGGLLGNNTTSSTGGLFGQQQQQPQSNFSVLGGNSSGLSGQSGGGLFGGSTNSQSGGFCSGSNTNNNAEGLFRQKQQAPSGGLFGNNTSATTSSLFGGQQQQQQQQQPQLTALTRFGDLSPALQEELTQLDAYINQQHLIATTLNSDLKKHDDLIKSIPTDVNFLTSKLTFIKQALRFDAEHLQSLKAVNDELTTDISNIMQLIIQLSTPGTKLLSSFQLHEFFAKKVKKYKETMESYETVVKESAAAISGLDKALADNSNNAYSLVDVVKNQYQLFMELCEVVAQIHNDVTKML